MNKTDIIFTVNPGATSTKCALFSISNENLEEIADQNIEHPDTVINGFDSIAAQVDYREKLVRTFIDNHLPENTKIAACAGRGGMLSPVPSGVIKVNEQLVEFSLHTPVYQHASNLGSPLAFRIAQSYDIDAYIVDPVSVDELPPIARISGSPDFPRFSFVHALNIRATIRKLSIQLNKDFSHMKCVAAHLGGGFSIAAFSKGRIIDNDNRMEGAAFTPERAGGVPPIPLVNACFSGKYTKKEIMKKLYGEAGLFAYLKTKDLRDVLNAIENGDEYTEMIYNAMVYQIAKEIASMASVLCFDMDGIIITGGLAYSKKLIADIKKRVNPIGDVFVFPGSNESEALANAVLRVLKGDDTYMTWPVKTNVQEH